MTQMIMFNNSKQKSWLWLKYNSAIPDAIIMTSQLINMNFPAGLECTITEAFSFN